MSGFLSSSTLPEELAVFFCEAANYLLLVPFVPDKMIVKHSRLAVVTIWLSELFDLTYCQLFKIRFFYPKFIFPYVVEKVGDLKTEGSQHGVLACGRWLLLVFSPCCYNFWSSIFSLNFGCSFLFC